MVFYDIISVYNYKEESVLKLSEIKEGLIKNNYIPTKQILYAVSGAINQQFPVLIEGDPGVGKTSLAKAVASMLGLPLYRVQFYEGLSADKILYDYDYQKQLLTIESIKSSLEEQLQSTTETNVPDTEESETTAPGEIEQRIRIMDGVIRYLCVKQEA